MLVELIIYFSFVPQVLDGAIRELMNEVNRQISEKQIPLQPPTSTKLELHVTRAESVKS